ncbi:MAG TPA: zf-HC2 domain-containing protein [Caldimonas sp.]
MKARVVPLDSDEHRLAQELLPWFVNKTLDAAEAAQVGAHVAQCARCQADAAAQARLRAVVLDADHPGAGVDAAWTAMRARLDTLPASRGTTRASTRASWRPDLRSIVAAQAAVLLVLAVAWVGGVPRGDSYRALGAAPADANALAVFRAEATEAQMREALRAAGAHIVGGPTVTDAYLLRLGDAGPAALARLREQPAVLRAESLQGEAAR